MTLYQSFGNTPPHVCEDNKQYMANYRLNLLNKTSKLFAKLTYFQDWVEAKGVEQTGFKKGWLTCSLLSYAETKWKSPLSMFFWILSLLLIPSPEIFMRKTLQHID